MPRAQKKAAPDRLLFTKASLDRLLHSRPKEQRTIWDKKTSGLCVLLSRGPAHSTKATLTFRVVYYLRDRPGIPRYVKIGRYGDKQAPKPDGSYLDCSDIDRVRDRANVIRAEAQSGSDPKRPKLTGAFPQIVDRYIAEYASKNRTWKETKRILDRYVVPECAWSLSQVRFLLAYSAM